MNWFKRVKIDLDRILQWRKLRARKRKKYKAYFRIVDKIAKRQAAQMVKEKLSR